MIRRIQVGTTLGFTLLATACSTEVTTQAAAIGGTSTTSVAGGDSSVGGLTNGGHSGAGGASTMGGVSSQAGDSGTGGDIATTAAGGGGAGSSSLGSGGAALVGGTSATAGGGIATGGVTATGGSGQSLVPTGGALSTGGGSAAGGATTGGAPATGGSLPIATGGAVTTATGGSVSVATGGAVTTVTGGAVGTGGAMTGGASATGGMPATGGSATLVCTGSSKICGNTCADIDKDPANCGDCGHSCLGGECASGLCQAAILGWDSEVVNDNLAATVFYADSNFVFYLSEGGIKWLRESKTDLNGSGTALFSGGSSLGNTSVIGGMLYVNYAGTMIKRCSHNECTATFLTVEATGHIITNNTPSNQLALLDEACPHSRSFCINWLNPDFSVFNSYEDQHDVIANGSSRYDSFKSAGDTVYWIARDFNAASTFVSGGLFYAKSDLSRGQLAGGLPESMTILGVNDASVILANSANDLYRVSLPLGLGSDPPQPMGINGTAVTEDKTKFYWIDSQGNLYDCLKSSCANTKAIRANGQSGALSILQDAAAIYWGHGHPSRVMRLAK